MHGACIKIIKIKSCGSLVGGYQQFGGPRCPNFGVKVTLCSPTGLHAVKPGKTGAVRVT